MPGVCVVGGDSLGVGIVPTLVSPASHMAGQVKLSGTQVSSIPKLPCPPSSSDPPQFTSAIAGASLQQQLLVGMGVRIHSMNHQTLVQSLLKVLSPNYCMHFSIT